MTNTYKTNRITRLKELEADASAGFSDAQYDLGMHFYKGIGGVSVCIATATKWLLAASEQNHADALLWLGEIYADSEKVELRQQVRSMYVSAALHGNVEAQWRLSCLYANDEDDTMAMRWLEKAAECGHKDAQLELAEACRVGMYRYRADLEKAAIWYAKAAAQGSEHAQHVLNDIQAGA